MNRALRGLEISLVLVGICCIAAASWLQFEQRYYGRWYLNEFERAAEAARSPKPLPPGAVSPQPAAAPSAIPALTQPPRPRADGVPLGNTVVLARLRIADIGLDAPVLEGVGDQALRRGAGWIPGTARPGEKGNIGIAAHRDTFFRPLRQVRSGDRVNLETPTARQSFMVRSVYVVAPEYINPLRPTSEDMLTLVTCFPFDYLGAAPRRYIVQAIAERAGQQSE